MEAYENMADLIREIDAIKVNLPDPDQPRRTLKQAAYDSEHSDNGRPDIVILGRRYLVYRLGQEKTWTTARIDVLQDPTEDCPGSILEKAAYELSRITIVEDDEKDVDHFFIDNVYSGTFGLTRVKNI